MNCHSLKNYAKYRNIINYIKNGGNTHRQSVDKKKNNVIIKQKRYPSHTNFTTTCM